MLSTKRDVKPETEVSGVAAPVGLSAATAMSIAERSYDMASLVIATEEAQAASRPRAYAQDPQLQAKNPKAKADKKSESDSGSSSGSHSDSSSKARPKYGRKPPLVPQPPNTAVRKKAAETDVRGLRPRGKEGSIQMHEMGLAIGSSAAAERGPQSTSNVASLGVFRGSFKPPTGVARRGSASTRGSATLVAGPGVAAPPPRGGRSSISSAGGDSATAASALSAGARLAEAVKKRDRDAKLAAKSAAAAEKNQAAAAKLAVGGAAITVGRVAEMRAAAEMAAKPTSSRAVGAAAGAGAVAVNPLARVASSRVGVGVSAPAPAEVAVTNPLGRASLMPGQSRTPAATAAPATWFIKLGS